MVLTFGRLKAHDAHRDDIIYVDAMMPDMETDLTKVKTTALPQMVQTIVSVVFDGSHFAVMRLCLVNKIAYFYDGLSMPHENWKKHMQYVLSRYAIRHHEWTLKTGKGKDGMDGINIKQKDQSNCGPIACMVLLKLFMSDHLNLSTIPPSNYRRLALDELHKLINRHQKYCVVYKRKKRIPGMVGFIDITKSTAPPASMEDFGQKKLPEHDMTNLPSYPNDKSLTPAVAMESEAKPRSTPQATTAGERKSITDPEKITESTAPSPAMADVGQKKLLEHNITKLLSDPNDKSFTQAATLDQ